MADDRLSNSFSLIVRRAEAFEYFPRDNATVDVERHSRRSEVCFSGSNVVEHTREGPGTSAEIGCMLGEQLLCDDIACK